jgi:hypothetical protein
VPSVPHQHGHSPVRPPFWRRCLPVPTAPHHVRRYFGRLPYRVNIAINQGGHPICAVCNGAIVPHGSARGWSTCAHVACSRPECGGAAQCPICGQGENHRIIIDVVEATPTPQQQPPQE